MLELNNLDVEQALIGDILYRSSTLYDVADIIKTDDLWHKQHRDIYQACLDLGDRADVVTVHNRLGDELSGGIAYLAGMARNATAAGNAAHYARIIRDLSRRRKLIALAEATKTQAHHDPADDVIATATAALADLDQDEADPVILARDASGAWIDDLNERIAADGGPVGLTTGLKDLDRRLHGLRPGRLYLVAGRPAMGKSILGLKIAVANALAGETVLLASLEMPVTELMDRIHSSLGRIPLESIETGVVSDEDMDSVVATTSKIESMPLFFSDSSQSTITSLIAKAKRLKRRNGLSLLVLDYVQLMDGIGENRTQQIGSITRALKRLAKELDIPIVALSQLNRGLEQRQDKRPILSDLRESGDIEQDADVVMMLYRDEIYYAEDSSRVGVCDIYIRKFRSGKTGMVATGFQGDYVDLVDLANPPPLETRKKQQGFDI